MELRFLFFLALSLPPVPSVEPGVPPSGALRQVNCGDLQGFPPAAPLQPLTRSTASTPRLEASHRSETPNIGATVEGAAEGLTTPCTLHLAAAGNPPPAIDTKELGQCLPSVLTTFGRQNKTSWQKGGEDAGQ
ncbi:hypothetical protein HJG60_009808 [Phyllostomus discolor]|uniref:Uncharacterized protein n=1 Tax=Phyllostomus discolor TaxID=89673 RepID=A0A834B2L0_9CHIR|nr:hypothetical protein HJG60_009808 [Phyllostomus discolor]